MECLSISGISTIWSLFPRLRDDVEEETKFRGNWEETMYSKDDRAIIYINTGQLWLFT